MEEIQFCNEELTVIPTLINGELSIKHCVYFQDPSGGVGGEEDDDWRWTGTECPTRYEGILKSYF